MFSIYIFLYNFTAAQVLLFLITPFFATAMQMKFIAIQDGAGIKKLCQGSI